MGSTAAAQLQANVVVVATAWSTDEFASAAFLAHIVMDTANLATAKATIASASAIAAAIVIAAATKPAAATVSASADKLAVIATNVELALGYRACSCSKN